MGMTLLEYFEKKFNEQIKEAKTVLDREDFYEFCVRVRNIAWDAEDDVSNEDE